MLGESQDEVRKQAVDFSVELVKRVFSEKELSGFRDKITREILSVLVSNDSVKEAIKKNGTIEIITAEKFAKKDRSYIAEEVAKNCGSGIGIKFSVQKDIMAGLILKTGESIINGGVMHRIVEMAKKMKEEL